MTKTMRRLYWMWQYEKEEQWLSDMSRQGWQLKEVAFGRYRFEQAPAETYIYRLEYLSEHKDAPKSKAYLDFLKDTGVEVAGNLHNWVYLRRPATMGPFEIYSDPASRIAHVQRMLTLVFLLAVANTAPLLSNLGSFARKPSVALGALVAISLLVGVTFWYGTLRLWQMIHKLQKQKQQEQNTRPVF